MLDREKLRAEFRAYLNEAKIIGKLKPYESSLISGYMKFLQDYFDIQKEVNVILKKPDSKTMFGYIDLIAMSSGKYDIIVKYEFGTILGHIAHEFTHVKQYLKSKRRIRLYSGS